MSLSDEDVVQGEIQDGETMGHTEMDIGSESHGMVSPFDTTAAAGGSNAGAVEALELQLKQLQLQGLLEEEKAKKEIRDLELESKKRQARNDLRKAQLEEAAILLEQEELAKKRENDQMLEEARMRLDLQKIGRPFPPADDRRAELYADFDVDAAPGKRATIA